MATPSKQRKTASKNKSSVSPLAQKQKKGKLSETSSVPDLEAISGEIEESQDSPLASEPTEKVPVFKDPNFVHSRVEATGNKKARVWKNLKQIVAAEKTLPWQPDDTTYGMMDAPPSFKPAMKYSDLSGLPVGNMAEAKKKRENFTEFEKTLILGLIEPHANTLESKKNDLKSLQAREQLWTNIVLSFNGNRRIHTHRTSAQLKELYKRLKVVARKKYKQYNKQIRGTGGGEKIQSPDKLSKIVYKLIPQDFKSLNNPYDDDVDDESTDTQSLIGDKDDNSQLSTQSGTIQECSIVPESEDFGINRPTITPTLAKAGPSSKKRASEESM